MLKKYFIYQPSVQGNIDEEWEQCLKQIMETRLAGNRPVKLNIFADLPDFDSFIRTRKKIVESVTESFDTQAPATSFTVHPPEKPWKIAIEVLFIVSESRDAVTKHYDSIPYVVIKTKSLSNPNQVNAYEYGQEVLKGTKNAGKGKKQPPQFERAFLLTSDQDSLLFISGTASIKGQVTIGRDDVGKQSMVTIENITKLADIERINQVVGEAYQYSLKYSLFQVYIKYRKDFCVVKTICKEHFPSVPEIYVKADICRNDLLTEIEAELVQGY